MIVCVEGTNGSGKTTLASALAASWTRGHSVAIDPVQHTPFGVTVRGAIMTDADLGADAETLAFASARLTTADALANHTRPPVSDLIVLERWTGAVVAYGTAAGSSPFLLRALEATLTGALPVDLTLLVDIPGDIAAVRLAAHTSQTNKKTNKFETRGSAYLERVRRQYLAWASLRQVPVINGLRPAAQVAAQAKNLVEITAAAITSGEDKESA